MILNYATKHSLILIDELGRGTTTFDGCAIAYSVAKFLTQKQCRTLFSTHYHELMREFQTMKNMKVYHMTVQEVRTYKKLFQILWKISSHIYTFLFHFPKYIYRMMKMWFSCILCLQDLAANHMDSTLPKWRACLLRLYLKV